MKSPTLHLLDVPTPELRAFVVENTAESARFNHGGILVTICSRASTRTRASAAAAAQILGMGHVEIPWNSFYGNPEAHPAAASNMSAEIRSLAEIGARAVIARVVDQQLLVSMSEGSTIPIISGATSYWHPLQALADLRVILGLWPQRSELRLAFVGNGQGPVISSLLTVLTHSDVHVTVIAPEGHFPRQDVLECSDSRRYDCTSKPSAMESADIVYTDEWFYRPLTPDVAATFGPYRITEEMINAYAPHARIMHCLPFASEIEQSLLYGERSLVWQQARERTGTLVSVLEYLLGYDSAPG